MDARQVALVALGRLLHASGYVFVTPTPETHRRVLARARPREPSPQAPGGVAADSLQALRDLFGWNAPVAPERLPRTLRAHCEAADLLEPTADGQVVSRYRFASLELPAGRGLFVHSRFPTTSHDAVFFGPDTYRFVAAVRRTLSPSRVLVDVGCGTGAGGLSVADRAATIVLSDVSPAALYLARVNVALAQALGHLDDERRVALRESDVLAGVETHFEVDAVIANPPYLVDSANRLYRDGGGPLGTDLAARIVLDGVSRLRTRRRSDSAGQLVLYTGVPIVQGRNVLDDRLRSTLDELRVPWSWEELDPDVFGEELAREAYRETERLAAVCLNVTMAATPTL